MATKRILIIDDDPAVIESLSASLSPPYAVSSARNSESALAFLDTSWVSLIILDLVLGPEDGLALLPVLRRRTPAPILLVTGYGTHENLVRAIRAKPDDFLEKPVHVQALRHRVAACLGATGPETDPLERVRAWIAAECHQPLTIADLARAAGMSPAHFYRTFSHRFGVTPRAYLRQCRMHRAATLLRDGNDRIKALASEVGFSRANNFATAFKQLHGSTPKAFRRHDVALSPKKTDLDWDD